jgi:predicted enzyme related to lactoylglutathione lyase
VTDDKNNQSTGTININISKFIVNTVTVTGALGQIITPINVQVTGGIAPFNFTCIGLTEYGLAINSSTGEITGTPTKFGNSSLTVTVIDAKNNQNTGIVNIDISDFIISTTTITGRIGQLITPISVQTIGGVAPFVFSCAALTEYGLAINSSTGEITGTPTKFGNASLIVTVTDSANNQRTGIINIDISNFTVNTATVIGNIGQAITSVTVTTVGGNAPFIFSCDALNEYGLAINSSTGEITGTPTKPVNKSIPVTVSDVDNNTNTGTININISNFIVNTIVVDGKMGEAITPVTVTTSNGGVGPFTFSCDALNEYGLAINSSTGEVTGSPT